MRLHTGRQIERLALEHRLEFVEKTIKDILDNSHLEKIRGNYKKSLKRLRAERTRIKNKLK